MTVLSAASQGQRLHTRSTFSLHDKIGKILKSVMAYSPNCPLSPLPWPAPLPWTFYLINAEPLLFKTVSSSRIRETGALKWATGTQICPLPTPESGELKDSLLLGMVFVFL